ncbi:MAG: PAS domain S-box protein, partial [Anaerolineae bacterium]
MKDEHKTKEQLINELVELRQRVAELEAADIERVRAEEMLRESEAHYRLLAENMTDIIWTMDMNLRFTYVSPSVTSLEGYSVDEAMALSLKDILTPASLEIAMKTFTEELVAEKTWQRGAFRSRVTELEQRHKDGSIIWTEVTTTLLRDPDGRPVGIMGVTHNITERKRAEEALELKVKQLATLSQASQAVTASLELDQVLAEIVSLAGEVVASDYTGVVMVDEAGHLGQSAENLPGVPAIEYRIRDEGLTSWIIRSCQAVIIEEIGEDGAMIPDLGEGAPRFANPLIVEAGVKSVAGLPLMVKGRLLGVLYIHSLRPGAFHGQLPLLTTFANQVAIAVENARLYEAERRRSAEFEALRQASLHLTSTLELQPILEAILDHALKLVAADDAHVFLYDGERLAFGAALWEDGRQQ